MLHQVIYREGLTMARFDLLTMELDVMGDNCVHDRLTVMGGKEAAGSMCGDRSGEVRHETFHNWFGLQ